MKFLYSVLGNPWFILLFSAAADSFAAIVIKLKFNELGSIESYSFPSLTNYLYKIFQSKLILVALAAYICAPIMGFLALNKMDLTTYYPVVVILHFLFIGLGGWFLGEGISLNKIIGTILIMISLYFFYKK